MGEWNRGTRWHTRTSTRATMQEVAIIAMSFHQAGGWYASSSSRVSIVWSEASRASTEMPMPPDVCVLTLRCKGRLAEAARRQCCRAGTSQSLEAAGNRSMALSVLTYNYLEISQLCYLPNVGPALICPAALGRGLGALVRTAV